MKFIKLSYIALILPCLFLMLSCQEDDTTIGSTLVSGEVEITIDTITYQLNGKAVAIQSFDSKTGNLMIGKIQSKTYGNLDCSFVARLMCASSLDVADSLFYPQRVDSCKLILGAQRNEIIGDSLAPQRLTLYKLNKQLPSTINNLFDPEGYYDPSDILGSRSYTVSEVASSDSVLYNNSYVDISVDLPVEFGCEVFEEYKNNPSVFEWPQTMAKEFLPGIFVKSTFGNGCIANIRSVFVAIFYHSLEEKTTTTETDTITEVKHVNHMAVPFTVSPEVLSSNNIFYTPSQNILEKNLSGGTDGEFVVTTPGGYIGSFEFPAQDLIDNYHRQESNLSSVNELVLFIPGEPFDNTKGIGVAENILLVLEDEYEDFFAKNKTPDNLTSFTGVYDPTTKKYFFSTMRDYFLNLLKKDKIEAKDISFVMVPVEIETETSNSYYSTSTYVTKCVPLASKPTATLLKTNEAEVIFSFSTQIIK